MALRVVEHAGRSDVGRQREANEDNFVIAPPFYVVADGMGGARAGEVASGLAADVFRDARAEAGSPEQVLAQLIAGANRSIYDLAQRDETRRGMGTTITAALVTPAGVSIGHVGDSRAYRLRGGELEQLTHDHSLVAELERSGKITAEEAEHHPQRSIITRALGPEDSVEVDTHTHTARDGDVYLLCSDGLNTMLADADIAASLRSAGSLDEAAEALVLAANQQGGKDNITVVLMRVDDVEGDAPAPVAETTQETIHQGLTADDVRAAVTEQERARPLGGGSRATDDGRQTTGTTKVRSGRRVVGGLVALAVVAGIAFGAYAGARGVWFIGTDERGFVSLYRGLPYELPLGIELYSRQRVSGVPARTVSEARRERLLDHEWRSREDAEDLLRQLELGTLEQ